MSMSYNLRLKFISHPLLFISLVKIPSINAHFEHFFSSALIYDYNLDGNPNHEITTHQNRFLNGNARLGVNPFHLDVIQEGDSTELISSVDPNYKNATTSQRICYKCDSRENSKCKNDLDDSMTELCLMVDEDLGCFHMITGRKCNFFISSENRNDFFKTQILRLFGDV